MSHKQCFIHHLPWRCNSDKLKLAVLIEIMKTFAHSNRARQHILRHVYKIVHLACAILELILRPSLETEMFNYLLVKTCLSYSIRASNIIWLLINGFNRPLCYLISHEIKNELRKSCISQLTVHANTYLSTLDPRKQIEVLYSGFLFNRWGNLAMA